MVAARTDDEGDEPGQPDGIDPARGALLEEARTTLGEQLGQIDKIDEAAVRTVRLSVLLLGVVAGGATVGLGPGFGIATAAGVVGLILAVVGAVTVYGTSTVFAGFAPYDLRVEYTSRPGVEDTYVEMLSEYDAGIYDNRQTLRTNGFILGVSRALLVLSVVLILVGLLGRGVSAAATSDIPTAATAILMLLTLPSSSEMSDDEQTEGDEDTSIGRPVYLYTGPKPIADAKIRFGEWLEEKGL